MKRLIKKAFGKILYHGTNLENFKNIASSGMIFPQETNGAGPGTADEQDYDGYTFFATSYEKAQRYANWASSDNNPPVVIELELPESSLLPDDNDCRDCKTWQESENAVQQVKVLGPVSDEYITEINFYDTNSRLFREIPYHQWQEFLERYEDRLLYPNEYEYQIEEDDEPLLEEDYEDFDDYDDLDDLEIDEELLEETKVSKIYEKRLIKKAFEKTLYHGTNLERLKKITETGMILPNEEMGDGPGGEDESTYDGYTFFATTLRRAEWYANRVQWYENPPVVIEVEVPEDALLPDDNDLPSSKTWEDSAKAISQVKILGPISSEYIKSVRFYNSALKEIGKVPFHQWQSFFEKHKEEILNVEYDDDEYEDEDHDYFDDYYNKQEKTKEIKKKKEECIEKLKSMGIDAKIDNYGLIIGSNGSIKTFYDIVNDYDFLTEDAVFGIISQNGDVLFSSQYPDDWSAISFKYYGSSCIMDGSTSELINNVKVKEGLSEKIKESFEGLNMIFTDGTYTPEQIIDIISNKVESKIKYKRLIRLSAITPEQYIQNYPSGYEHVSKGIQSINVNDIIGMTMGRHDEYDDNLLPIGEPDQRWKSLYEKAKQEGNLDFAGPIRVVKVPNENKYFIYDDGNHRASVAKYLGIPTIKAEVIELIPKNQKQNNDLENQMEEIKKKINNLTEQLNQLKIQQEKIWDDKSLNFEQKNQKSDEIELEKEKLYDEIDNLWKDFYDIQNKLS